MRIGPERAEDQSAVAEVVALAFGSPYEALLVEALRQAGELLLSLVARDGAGIIGHIGFQPVQVSDPDNGPAEDKTAGGMTAASLAPLSVRPGHQRQGVGSGLVHAGLAALRARAIDVVFVVGDPAYYGRFGFSAAAAQGFEAPWRAPYFQALRLREDAPTAGVLTYPRAFFDGVA